MIHQKIATFYQKNVFAAYSITVAAFILAVVGIGSLWAVNKYWHPPLLQFTQSDMAKTVTFDTTAGKFTVALDANVILPKAQFTRLAVDKFYNQTRVHRIVPDLLIEMGDPLTKDPTMKHFWGEGGLANAFPNETHKSDVMSEGTVALSSSGEGTYGSQFFVVTKTTPWLAGKHTIIGHVIRGMDIVHAIEDMPHLPTGLPVDDVVINAVIINE